MEIIVLILVIIFIASSGKKKNKAAPKDRTPSAAVPPATAASKAAVSRALAERTQQREAEVQTSAARTPAQQKRDLENIEALKRAAEKARRRADAARLQNRQAAQPAAPQFAQGEGHADDEGCVGGSLPHDHAEGESREEHARHIAAMEARDREELLSEPRSLDARQLRRAVVMAEVLNRPKALQSRRRAGY